MINFPQNLPLGNDKDFALDFMPGIVVGAGSLQSSGYADTVAGLYVHNSSSGEHVEKFLCKIWKKMDPYDSGLLRNAYLANKAHLSAKSASTTKHTQLG